MVDTLPHAEKEAEAVHHLLELQEARIALVRATDRARLAAAVGRAEVDAVMDALDALALINRHVKDLLDAASAAEAAGAVALMPVRRASPGREE
jgi:hypothetical protein